MVNNEWKKTRLGSLTKIYDGTHQTPIYVESGIPFYSVEHVTANQFADTKFIAENVFEKENQRVKLEKGDILMTRIGDIGTARLIDWDVNASFYVSLALIKKNPKFDSSYLSFYINSNLFQSELWKRTIHVAFPKKINLGEISNCEVILPPLPEQKKIAEILSTWDKAIETVEKLVANSQQQKKALMQQLLTGQKRLLDENGVKFKGEWENIKLKNLIKECQKEKETDPNRIELLTVKLHNKGVVASGKFPNATEKGRPYYKRLEGELIIGRQNLHNGGVGIVPSECNGLIASNAISSFQPLENVDIKFILYMMMTNHFKYLVDNLSGGTGQKEVSVNELMKVNLLVPSFEEQRKIAQVLTLADREIDLYQQQLNKLKLEKKSLMQQLLTGQKRVTVN